MSPPDFGDLVQNYRALLVRERLVALPPRITQRKGLVGFFPSTTRLSEGAGDEAQKSTAVNA